MTTIAYDLPVKNLIAGLDATGHVTHTQHRKTHVTLHHNGGRLSHEGVLQVWQTRPASAQFDIDVIGDCAQYVRVAEYAWACGSTDGNQRSISIEMCNLSLGPDWVVAEATWRSAARLAGWLFARVIGYRPTREFLVQHEYWSATACAGPYIDKVYEQILALAQEWYDKFTGAVPIEEEEIMLYAVTGDINKTEPDWLEIPLPPVRQSVPLPAGNACAWVQLICPQYPLDIWGVYRQYDGGSELIWGPGFDPRQSEQLGKQPVVLKPDTYKKFKIDSAGSIGVAVLYSGRVKLTGLATMSPHGF